MKIETNHILYIARLPLHFWNEMRDAEDYRDNIGLWLISWVVARALTLEYVDLPKELQPAFDECETFTEEMDEIADWFGKQLKVMLSATDEKHSLYGKLSALAYNYFAGMASGALLQNKRDLLITSKIEFDGLKEELLKTPPPKPVYA